MLKFRNIQNETERDAYQMSEFITVLHTFFTVIYPSNNEKLQDRLSGTVNFSFDYKNKPFEWLIFKGFNWLM